MKQANFEIRLATMAIRGRRLKKMAANIAAMVDWPYAEKARPALSLGLCPLCKLPWHDHPTENGFTLACNGDLLKLSQER